MKNVFLALLAVAAPASLATAARIFEVNTPINPIECVTTLISWQGGHSPFTLIISEPDAHGTPVQIYTDIPSSPFNWSTNVTAGTSFGITVRDSTGANAQSAPAIVQAGPDTSCLNGGTSSGY